MEQVGRILFHGLNRRSLLTSGLFALATHNLAALNHALEGALRK
jgi:hypothetical protein